MIDSSFQSIIGRLQKFMDQTGMGISAFADYCSIPRPTLSQLFSGRTKSVNDVILAKLAGAFPDLNIAWLLFGQGEMRGNSNIEISEPQNTDPRNAHPPQSATQQPIETPQGKELPREPQPVNRIESAIGHTDSCETNPSEAPGDVNEPLGAPYGEKKYPSYHRSSPIHESRSIQSIVVLYTDGTFETYSPT